MQSNIQLKAAPSVDFLLKQGVQFTLDDDEQFTSLVKVVIHNAVSFILLMQQVKPFQPLWLNVLKNVKISLFLKTILRLI
jgi:hypothetical protein